MTSKPPHQPSLFSAAEARACMTAPQPFDSTVTAEALQQWKARIVAYQASVQPAESQASLFDSPPQPNPEAIAPFALAQQNFFFFNWPADRHPDSACLYFVIDSASSLLLYVGETCRANQRWKGVHDCKQYVLNYQTLHFRYRLQTAINTAFYWEAPVKTRPRQQLESKLIRRWRSPFNKENWRFWGTPFV
ncbi:MAG: GIY-YIG nuclease family protein [Elainellaceae cyanobacterium]